MNSAIRFTSAALFTASFVTAPAALAQGSVERDQSGPYISGSYGGYKSHGGEFEDENDLLGAAVGYQFNPFLALEAEYIDFGNFGEDNVEGKLKGFGLGAVGRLPLTDSFGVYGKAGAFASAFDVDAFNESETYDEVSPFVGAGVDFRVTPDLTAFAEYNRYNIDIDKEDFNGQVTNSGPEFDTGRVGLKYQF
ncbi:MULTISPECIES: porin family protein [unclassified Marinobacter]|jgi:opacity protein-like surface antigen|uniref:porin family protein n=1 Tax=unclassified Marinobacter TaxID=83889 RepID=UPI001927AA94|nr:MULTISPECIES: porin family protein [unclassified Marinobacter]MBL3823351.1 porin family protein [Marinobacter sp. MC3]MBL3892318.1 porin family protein [Marinobacter sp. MW3]